MLKILYADSYDSTCFVGGLGFIVIRECWVNRFRWRKLSMHSRVSIFMAVFLLIGGAVLLKLTNPISWLVAFSAANRRDR